MSKGQVLVDGILTVRLRIAVYRSSSEQYCKVTEVLCMHGDLWTLINKHEAAHTFNADGDQNLLPWPNCCFVRTQDLVFSVYNLSPCTVIRHPSLHTSSQGGVIAPMIVSSKGHSSVVRKLLQAGSTVDTTNWV